MNVSVLGVFVGGIADVGTSFLLGMPLAAYILLHTRSASGPVAVAAESAYARMHAHPILASIQMLLSLLCSVFGGYIAAAIAGRSERLNGTLSCYLCVGLGLLLLPFGLNKDPWWLQAFFILLSPLMAFVGGDVRLRSRMRKRAVAASA